MASRICWNCETKTHLTPTGDPICTEDQDIWTRAYKCDNCRHLSVAIVRYSGFIDPMYISQAFEEPDAPINWLPTHALGRRFNDVPNEIADAASEAYACYSIRSYRAAALLARSVVEATAKNKGVTKGSLVAKIEELNKQRVISPGLAEAAHEIRLVGNEMAHGDFINTIDEADCDDLLDFMSSILEDIYQRPTVLARRKEQRERRNETSKST